MKRLCFICTEASLAGIGRRPEAIDVILLISIVYTRTMERPPPTAVSLLTWEVYHAIFHFRSVSAHAHGTLTQLS